MWPWEIARATNWTTVSQSSILRRTRTYTIISEFLIPFCFEKDTIWITITNKNQRYGSMIIISQSKLNASIQSEYALIDYMLWNIYGQCLPKWSIGTNLLFVREDIWPYLRLCSPSPPPKPKYRNVSIENKHSFAGIVSVYSVCSQ